MTLDRLRALLAIYRGGLLDDTLPFWIPRAIDRECGGYLTALDRDGSVLQTDKSVWAYAHFPDPLHGEWFGYLHRDGSVSTRLKGNLWKGPFHLPRMQWYCAERVSEMLQQAAP